MVTSSTFAPGDAIYFKRGTQYSGCVTISGDGTEDSPLSLAPMALAQPHVSQIRITTTKQRMRCAYRGLSYCRRFVFSQCGFRTVTCLVFRRSLGAGALHIGLERPCDHSQQCLYPKSKSHSVLQRTQPDQWEFHRRSESVAAAGVIQTILGPIGIQLGIGNQEIADNYIANMYVEGGEYEADGGAVEIDDGSTKAIFIFMAIRPTTIWVFWK